MTDQVMVGNVSAAIVFLGIVGLVVVMGIVVGMIVAGRLDRLMTPGPRPPADGPGAAAGPERDPAQPEEEQQP